MNQSPILKQVWLTVTLEYTFSPGYQAAELIWLDAAGCFGSDVPAKEGAYELRSKPWVWTGAKGGKGKKALRLLGGGGHVHGMLRRRFLVVMGFGGKLAGPPGDGV